MRYLNLLSEIICATHQQLNNIIAHPFMRFVGVQLNFQIYSVKYKLLQFIVICQSYANSNYRFFVLFSAAQLRILLNLVVRSYENNFANLAVITIQMHEICCTLWYNEPLTKKTQVCKRTTISTTSSTNLLYSIFAHAKRLYRPGPEKMLYRRLADDMLEIFFRFTYKLNFSSILHGKCFYSFIEKLFINMTSGLNQCLNCTVLNMTENH